MRSNSFFYVATYLLPAVRSFATYDTDYSMTIGIYSLTMGQQTVYVTKTTRTELLFYKVCISSQNFRFKVK